MTFKILFMGKKTDFRHIKTETKLFHPRENYSLLQVEYLNYEFQYYINISISLQQFLVKSSE